MYAYCIGAGVFRRGICVGLSFWSSFFIVVWIAAVRGRRTGSKKYIKIKKRDYIREQGVCAWNLAWSCRTKQPRLVSHYVSSAHICKNSGFEVAKAGHPLIGPVDNTSPAQDEKRWTFVLSFLPPHSFPFPFVSVSLSHSLLSDNNASSAASAAVMQQPYALHCHSILCIFLFR
jgi:hypothetical protein